MDYFISEISEAEIKRERQKARELRRSQWWKNRIAKGLCHWCRAQFPPDELTMDHIVPVIRGGKSSRGNLVPSCKQCNNRKKHLLPVEWRQYLTGLPDDGGSRSEMGTNVVEKMVHRDIKAVIYDCDGVMFDSFEANLAFYLEVMEHFGKPLDRGDAETMRVLHTYSNKDVLAYLFAGDGRMAEVRDFSATIDYRKLFPLMQMEEGLRETLDALRGRVELAVCTNRANSMESLLESFGLDRYFSCVMTAGRVTHPKPHPEPLLKVLEQYGIGAHQALFIGDSEVDRLAAEAAGVPFVAYRADMRAIARIDRHRDLLSLL